VLEVDRAELPDPKRVQPGDELVAEAPDGEGLPMRVLEVRAETVVVDANHPLAGMTLHYEVKVLIVRSATGREIERAARELADAEEHEHGPDCDHDLVSLGTNKRQLN
jgi:FKBP-type peptidyl-prolyl cis-trans isomerase SlyD